MAFFFVLGYKAYMSTSEPVRPPNSFRVTITLDQGVDRMDNVLLDACRKQEDHPQLHTISRAALKQLFNDKKIMIKGQRAKSNSSLAAGITYVDILGF